MQKTHRLFVVLLVLAATLAPSSAWAQNDEASPVVVTHGGYGAFGGALAFGILGLAVSGAAGAIYANPIDANCTTEPQRCRRTPLEHVLVGAIGAAAIAGVAGSGYASQKLAEKWNWNPVTGWSLAGAYLGLPAALLLQNVIPEWKPAWSRDLVGVTLGAAGSIGSAYAFGAIARDRGHAWPEFGFGAGGMGVGLLVGAIVAPDTVWVPILGGIGAVLGASAATLAF